LLQPAQTRYEQPGGGTETSTERYILFSPEIAGRRIGEAKPEWQIFMQIAERAYPERKHLIHFADTQQIRQEIAKAVSSYDGIQHLRVKGQAVQWGGPLLCADGNFPTPTGRAAFSAVWPPGREIPEGWFRLSTRRGKQFNSIVHSNYDPLTGSDRDHIFLNPEDAKALGIRDGDPILVQSETGKLRGRAKLMPIQRNNVQAHWPESNALIKRGVRDAESGIPDYNALVQVIPLSASSDAAHNRGILEATS
jgi:anaerobic selenocysteine-containing dehydrogenase